MATLLEYDWLIIIIMGGLFILSGIGYFFWGRGEEKSYYNAIATRKDVREYLEHKPFRPEADALKIGGWIAIGIGLLMIIMGGVFLR